VLSTAIAPSPVIDGGVVTFGLPDPTRRLDGVRLIQELGLDAKVDFEWQADGWRLDWPCPPVDRMEYLLEIVDHNGNHATITDPGNPLQVPGAFATKSVVQFPGYHEPKWLVQSVEPGLVRPLAIDTRAHDATITGALWTPTALADDEPAPLLVVHDGPEYSQLGSLTQYLAALTATRELVPIRAALLGPGERNAWYSANPAYAKALCTEVIPELDRIAPATVRIGVGVSLGALAMLHAHRSYPAIFGGLLLQSGSFFTPRLDPQESGFGFFERLTTFVADVESGTADHRPIAATMTCGVAEENLANNRRMAETLTALGYGVRFHEVRDAHNYTAWRDALDPALTELVARVVDSHAA
jgi:enterochelin esterase family protein